MPKRYFDLADDVSLPGRWDLGNPVDPAGQELDDPWRFTEGHALHTEGRLQIPLRGPGRPLDFTLAGFSIPIVHVRLGSLLAELAPRDVQLLPVDIQGLPEQYLLLVATRLIRCIDDARSTEVRYWRPEDGRPEKVGQYRSVYRMRIDPAKVGDAQLFRPWGWPGALILSEDLKSALERAKATGVKFTEV